MTTFKAIKPEIRSQRNAFGAYFMFPPAFMSCRAGFDSHQSAGNKDRFEKQRLKDRIEGFKR